MKRILRTKITKTKNSRKNFTKLLIAFQVSTEDDCYNYLISVDGIFMLVFSALPISRTELKFSRPPRMPSLLSFPISQKHNVFTTCWPNGVRNMCTTKLRCFSLRSNIYDFCLWMDGAYFPRAEKTL